MTISALVDRSYKPRTPRRFLVGRPREAVPAAEVRCHMATHFPPEDYDLSAPARAVLEAKANTCRFPFGEGETFRFCGEPATETAGGRLAYCESCARRMYQPTGRSNVHAPAPRNVWIAGRK